MTRATGRIEQGRTQLAMLLGYLDHDPGNRALLVDAADAAIDAEEIDRAEELLNRAAALASPEPRERNLAGLVAMRRSRFDEAAAAFESLLADGADDPALRYNLAWSRASLKNEAGALAALDDATVHALPQAAALEVQLLHALGRLDEAHARGRRHLAADPDGRALVAHVDREDDAARAEALFGEALAAYPNTARAWVGLGLAHLLLDKKGAAAAEIDRGAALFGGHLGSWIAAGWAHFIAGDLQTSRARFEHALALDDTFAETHGSLAVLDALAGDAAAARERARIARRLDSSGFSAALAQLLLSADDPARSRAILDAALHAPIGGGRTIARSLARLGLALTPTR